MWQPMHDRLLVERLPSITKMGAIYIPDVAQENEVLCKVLAVGPGAWRDGEFVKTAVKPGDTVLVPGAGNKFPDWEAGQQILIQEGDVGAIIG